MECLECNKPIVKIVSLPIEIVFSIADNGVIVGCNDEIDNDGPGQIMHKLSMELKLDDIPLGGYTEPTIVLNQKNIDAFKKNVEDGIQTILGNFLK